MNRKGDWSWIAAETAKRGMSITRVAQYIDITEQAVRKWIRGQSPPSLEHAQRLADLFTGGSLDRLIAKTRDSLEHLLDMDMQLKATSPRHASNVAPQFGDDDDAVLFEIPLKLLSSGDKRLEGHTANYVVEANRLLIHARRFRALKAQAKDVLGKLVGQRTTLSAQMWCDVAYAEVMLGHYPEGAEAAWAAQKADHGRLGPALLADSEWLMADCLRSMSHLKDAREHGEESLRLYRKAGVPEYAEGPMWAEWALSRVDHLEGKLDAALNRCDKVKEVARRGEHRDGVALEIWCRAHIHEMRGELERSLELYQEAKQYCRRIDYLYWEASTEWRISEVLRKKGELRGALTLAEQTTNTFAGLENDDQVSTVWLVTANCYLHQGKYQEATKLFKKIEKHAKLNQDIWLQERSALSVQLCHLAFESLKPRPDYRAWLPIAAEQRPLATASWSLHTYTMLFQAEALRLNGHASAALDQFHALARRCADSGHQLEQAYALLGAAEAQRQMGQNDRSTVNQALKLFRKMGSSWGQTHALITTALLETNDSGMSAAYLNEAYALADKAGFRQESVLIQELQQGIEARRNHVLLFV